MIKFAESNSLNYPSRTIWNCNNSDITLALAIDFNTKGEILTKNVSKNYIAMKLDSQITGERIIKLVNKLDSLEKDIVLNVAGNGIYSLNGLTQEYVDEYVHCLLSMTVNKIKHKIILIINGGQSGVDQSSALAAHKLEIDCEILAPKLWKYRDISGKEIYGEIEFKKRFNYGI